MTETLIVDKDSSIDDRYKLLVKQIKALLSKDDKLISNLSNFTAALKQTFEKISWVGFYFFEDGLLHLGPFQGKLACTKIKIGEGVCGTAANKLETIIVDNVNKFPGHIACDIDSKSEIVIPILKNNKLYGVLDIDSAEYSSFNETDKKYLEELCLFLSENIL